MVTTVLLNVALMCATALGLTLRVFFFLPATIGSILSLLSIRRRSLRLHALLSGNRLLRTLAGPCVGTRTLAASREAAAMTHAPVAADLLEPLDGHRDLAPQVALG